MLFSSLRTLIKKYAWHELSKYMTQKSADIKNFLIYYIK